MTSRTRDATWARIAASVTSKSARGIDNDDVVRALELAEHGGNSGEPSSSLGLSGSGPLARSESVKPSPQRWSAASSGMPRVSTLVRPTFDDSPSVSASLGSRQVSVDEGDVVARLRECDAEVGNDHGLTFFWERARDDERLAPTVAPEDAKVVRQSPVCLARGGRDVHCRQ